ncbi:MAG: MaoC family dehydratase [Gammaproteobacteria bacterium]|nr:MaoC family dehydratase [Gammaproteobacteria bacterium]MCY4277553.1 MaoC family dehydratase [Gammaproteobacteria bacterium]
MAANPLKKLSSSSLSAYAINEDSNTVNRIHSDDVAHEHGFDGALVSGAHLFGHMSEVVTQALEETWLANTEINMRLIRPAYDGDELHIGLDPKASSKENLCITCRNTNGTLLSTLGIRFLEQLPEPYPLGRAQAPNRKSVRREIRWSSVRPGEAFSEIAWTPHLEENVTSAGAHAKDLSLWETGMIHPRLWMDLANRALTGRFVMPAWLHLETKFVTRQTLCVGRTYRLLAMPEIKWRRRGNEYLRLYIAVLDGDSPHMEIWHTANFLINRA